ncbi:MAG: pyroglutamyl-peptidase I [Lacipirellulaceae bacterium]
MTAFGPYGEWRENASWLALRALVASPSTSVELTTRLYPVDYAVVREQLASDLAQPWDVVLGLGQAPSSGVIRFEAFALNAARDRGGAAESVRTLEPTGPAAYRSSLPLGEWASLVRGQGIPAEVSLHAGDYLCNAALYWSHFLPEQLGREQRAAFVHLPLEPAQVAESGRDLPSMPAELSAHALRIVLEAIAAGRSAPAVDEALA